MFSNKQLNILLVYSHMRTGGIETLIVRMANWLILNGHNVTLFLFEPGELLSLLDKKVNIVVSPLKCFFFVPFFAEKYLKNVISNKINVIYSYGPEGCYTASYIYKYSLFINTPFFLNGIYHPCEFSLGGGVSITDRIRINLYNKYINDRSKIFMSEEVKSGNEIILEKKIYQSNIWPLAINDSKYKNIPIKTIKYKIVSIGRFTHFKTYNIYMIDVIKDLVNMGYDSIWEVYGSGPLEMDMKKKIKENDMEKRVLLKGVLPYAEIAEKLSSAHVFVGMGTALIEAGFCRVPCVPAIAYDEESLTYGSLYNLPYYTCGERLSDSYSTLSVTAAICRIFEMDKNEYICESEKTFQYVQAYSMELIMKKFMQYIGSAPNKQNIGLYPGWKFIIYGLATFYQKIKGMITFKARMKHVVQYLSKKFDSSPF